MCIRDRADGDLYHGLTKKLTFDRMVPPHGLEVTYDKTCLLYTSLRAAANPFL